MKHFGRRTLEFLRGETAAEVSELAIVLALIVAGAVVTIVAIGPKVKQFFVDTNSKLP